LDTLPGVRGRLWSVKIGYGLILTLALMLLLFVLTVMLLLPPDSAGDLTTLSWLLLLLIVAIEAYSWGLYASTVCGSVLVSAGLAAVLVFGGWSVALVTAFINRELLTVARLLLAGMAVAGSYQNYCRPDWLHTDRALARFQGLLRPVGS